ncbi:hypothetical protein PIB30_068697 [Stylosanthes scabra]|uniref:PB1-like domain-containing protein n=1 Tax=Stylosanthes scabra TaxID=79078 RepID=A0ABU6RP40_9FABA|nr:hypothetical protein [Stylosanthes scabra]
MEWEENGGAATEKLVVVKLVVHRSNQSTPFFNPCIHRSQCLSVAVRQRSTSPLVKTVVRVSGGGWLRHFRERGPIQQEGSLLSQHPRDSKLNLVYDGGEETAFDNVNPEKLNLMVMKELFKGLGYTEYDYMYWLDEEVGLNGGGLNIITGDLSVVIIGEWALKHESQVHVYFEHPVDKAVEFVNLEEEAKCVKPQH